MSNLKDLNLVPIPWKINESACGEAYEHEVLNMKSLVNCGHEHSEAVMKEIQPHLMLQTLWL